MKIQQTKVTSTVNRVLNQPLNFLNQVSKVLSEKDIPELIEKLKDEKTPAVYKSLVMDILKNMGKTAKKSLSALEDISIEIGKNYTLTTKKEILHFQSLIVETIEHIRKSLRK